MKLVITPWKKRLGVFLLNDDLLVEAGVYDLEQNICIGDIYLGRVNKVLPEIKACFVQVGSKEEVFLALDEVPDGLKTGENILVQIKKEASKGKQPLATTKLSLTGRYCVLSNEKHSIEISKKLNSNQRKYWTHELQEILNGNSFNSEDKALLEKYCLIIRTNVSNEPTVKAVLDEWLILAKKMEFVTQKGKYQALYSKVYKEKTAYLQFIMNRLQDGFDEIIVDDKMIYEEIKEAFAAHEDILCKIRYYQDSFSLTKLYSLESKMDDALSKKVWLKSGGFLFIEPTEALTVIDVNSGKFEKKMPAEDYYKKVNEEAAVEIARQLKLRNISGIIIVDFINMQSADNQKDLLDSLSKLVSMDKIKTFVVGMTTLGLVEITREKKEKPLWEQI